MFIPPPMAKDAAVSAAQAGIKTLVVLTEHIPAQDVMAMHAAAAKHGTRIVGPNTAGLVTPGECFVGIMPAFVPSVFKPGRVGVISRSGSLGTLVCLNLTRAGIGQSAFIGIGGDPMLGTTTRDALEALDKDAGTDAVVIVGEIGGAMEEDAAEYAKKMRKPMVAFIAGAAAPAGKKMGHAGAIVTGNAGSYASKRQALEAAGVTVVDTPSQIAPAVAAGLRCDGRPAQKLHVRHCRAWPGTCHVMRILVSRYAGIGVGMRFGGKPGHDGEVSVDAHASVTVSKSAGNTISSNSQSSE